MPVTVPSRVIRAPVVVTALLLCSLFLGACAGLRQPAVVAWPEALPPRSHFIAAYEADARLQERQSLGAYLQWIVNFYEGSPWYPRGWNDLVADQLAAAAGEAAARRREQRLRRLGRAIAAEWAKDNSVRRIDNRHLAVWGEAAGRALDTGTVDETLARIERDVRGLLAGDLPADRVSPERYHRQDPDDWFAF